MAGGTNAFSHSTVATSSRLPAASVPMRSFNMNGIATRLAQRARVSCTRPGMWWGAETQMGRKASASASAAATTETSPAGAATPVAVTSGSSSTNSCSSVESGEYCGHDPTGNQTSRCSRNSYERKQPRCVKQRKTFYRCHQPTDRTNKHTNKPSMFRKKI